MKASNPLLRTVALLTLAGLVCACATQPTGEMATARGAIEAARSAGAPAPELGRAQKKMALADRWVAAGDYGPARWLAEQAAVDAELAAARSARHAAS